MGMAEVERRMPEDDRAEEFVRRRLRDDHGELARRLAQRSIDAASGELTHVGGHAHLLLGF